MNICKWHVTAAMFSIFVVGCGGGDEVEEHANSDEQTAHAATTKVTTTETVGDVTLNSEDAKATEKETDFVPMFADKGARTRSHRRRSCPKSWNWSRKLEPEPVLPQPKLPPMKLLGFVNVDSERAMLKFDDELVLVGRGDKVSGVEILEVSSPALTVRFGDEQIAMNLYDRDTSGRPAPKRKGLRITRSGEASEGTDDANTRSTNPRLAVPTLPTDGRAPRGIPGLPSGGGRPSIPEFPEVSEST